MEQSPPPERRLLSLALVVLAVVLLAFVPEPTAYVGQSDAPGYLALARSEPAHSVHDGQVYLLHPPAYPCAIRLFSLVTGDLVSGGVLLGLASAAALVLVTYRLGLALELGTVASLGGALLLAASRVLAFTAHGVYREPWQVLLIHALLLFIVSPDSQAERPSARTRPVATVALAALAALTWDPVVLAVPFFAIAGKLAGRPRLGLAAAVAVLAVWLVWAEGRREHLEARETYPAGIDGLVEETRPLPWAAFLNPNFLEETRRHNAYFWPWHATPGRLALLVEPALVAKNTLVLDTSPFASSDTERVGWFVLALAGLGVVAVLLRAKTAEGRTRARRLLAVGLPVALLGAPGVLGLQARYSVTAVPVLALLAAHGAVELAAFFSRRPIEGRRAARIVLAAGAVIAAATLARGSRLTVTRPTVFEGRAVADVISKLAPTARVAAYVDWPSDLAWLLPGQRVLALPLRADRLDRFFADYGSEILVVPLELHRGGDPRATPLDRDRALGLSALAAIASRTQGASPSLVRLGVAFEAEDAFEPGLHAYELLARPTGEAPAPPPFEFYLRPGEGAAAARAILAGRVSPLELEILGDHRAAIAASGEHELAELLARMR
jgi:hypothetical protein